MVQIVERQEHEIEIEDQKVMIVTYKREGGWGPDDFAWEVLGAFGYTSSRAKSLARAEAYAREHLPDKP